MMRRAGCVGVVCRGGSLIQGGVIVFLEGRVRELKEDVCGGHI